MTVAEVRRRYLEFFKVRGHTIIPSAPIVPGNDPTTLFTSSGMQPLIPYLLGEDHPGGVRLANSQMSFRAGDIEEVGDNRHTTFFEMLGNWSLGDYFKQEQLPWVFEFLTDELGLDPNKLYVTVFAGDESTGMGPDMEAVEIWKELFAKKGVTAEFSNIGSEEAGYSKGMQGNDRIFAYDARKNWWSRSGTPEKMPAGEPGGPDSEVFYDFGLPHDPVWGEHCHPNCDCGRFVEIGNSVFMQFKKEEDGTFSKLPKQNVDFGGGLERITFATLNTPDVFLIDVFDEARGIMEKRSGKSYADETHIRSFRIILDHMRASTFMLAEGVRPANSEAGYVLRRLLRRAIREADRLGIEEALLSDVVSGFASAYQEHYPHVGENVVLIKEEISKEEEKFRKTLRQGLRELNKVGLHEFDKSIDGGQSYKSGNPTSKDLFLLFTSYGLPAEVAIDDFKTREKDLIEHKYLVQPHSSDFWGELLSGFDALMKEHQDKSRAGAAQKFAGGLADHSEQTVKYHTTHHILLKALQMVLGEDVKQRGSNITSERLRIDFASPGKMTDEQKAEVERLVNEVIQAELPVTRTVMKREEAETLGAQMEFGVKYPDTVTVYSVGPVGATEADPKISDAFSLEFCGGPHVTNTREIGEGGKTFKIQKEEAVAQGIRRIKGVLV